MKYLAWTPMRPGDTEPSQTIEWSVVESIRERGLEMPPVQRGWMRGGQKGGEISSEQFPGAYPIWYWEVK